MSAYQREINGAKKGVINLHVRQVSDTPLNNISKYVLYIIKKKEKKKSAKCYQIYH